MDISKRCIIVAGRGRLLVRPVVVEQAAPLRRLRRLPLQEVRPAVRSVTQKCYTFLHSTINMLLLLPLRPQRHRGLDRGPLRRPRIPGHSARSRGRPLPPNLSHEVSELLS